LKNDSEYQADINDESENEDRDRDNDYDYDGDNSMNTCNISL
ncbi:13532_t:CDS:1, partial [Entrophospora sp. SA101]